MGLTSGNYTITTKRAGYPIGRNSVEDGSWRPKKVVILPSNTDRPVWILEKLEDRNFTMKTRRGFAADIDSLLFAVLLDEPAPTRWKIEPQFHLGNNLYTISSTSRYRVGWTIPPESEREIGTQIRVAPLLGIPSVPSWYPTNELFEIISLD